MGAVLLWVGQGESADAQARVAAMAVVSPHRGALTAVALEGGALAVQAVDDDATLYSCTEGALAVHGFVGNRTELAARWGIPMGGAASLAEWLWSAWRLRGEAVLAELRGEWAMAVVETGRGEVVAARDRLGLRPLHWCAASGGLALASEARQALVGAGRPRRIDPERLAMRLANLYDDSGRTLYLDVNAVRPARVVRWARVQPGREQPRERLFWSPPAPVREDGVSFQRAVEEVRERITVALARTVPDRPCALSLSGGLDSGSLWALAITARQAGGNQWADRLRPFSLIYPGRPYDESERIRATHGVGGGGGVIIDASSQDLAEEFDELVGCLDYLAMPTLVHLKLTAQAVREDGRRVILTGMGGNEWLSGSLLYLAEYLRGGRVWAWLKGVLSLELPPGRRRWALIRGTLSQALNAGHHRPPVLPPWLHSRWQGLASRGNLLVGGGGRRYRSNRERMMENVRFYQAGSLLALEQYGAFLGVELRHPLCDGDLVDYCFTLPSQLFVGGRRPRHLHRLAAGPLLASATRDRLAMTTFEEWLPEALAGVLHRLPNRSVDWALARLEVASVPGLDSELRQWYKTRARSSATALMALAEGVVKVVSEYEGEKEAS